MAEGRVLFKGHQKFSKKEHYDRFCPQNKEHLTTFLHKITGLNLSLAWWFTKFAVSLTSSYFLWHILSRVLCQIYILLQFLPGDHQGTIKFRHLKNIDTLPKCIWDSFGINKDHIMVFKEPKEHFLRNGVLCQTIKTKECLCHSWM